MNSFEILVIKLLEIILKMDGLEGHFYHQEIYVRSCYF